MDSDEECVWFSTDYKDPLPETKCFWKIESKDKIWSINTFSTALRDPQRMTTVQTAGFAMPNLSYTHLQYMQRAKEQTDEMLYSCVTGL